MRIKKLAEKVKLLFSILLCITFFIVGYIVGRYRINRLFDGNFCSKVIGEKNFVGLEQNPYPDKVLENFYLTWNCKKGYAAFREVRQGFEGYFPVYWITENGRVKAVSIDNTKFFPTFYTQEFNTIDIGYDDPNGTFIKVFLDEPKPRNLQLRGE